MARPTAPTARHGGAISAAGCAEYTTDASVRTGGEDELAPLVGAAARRVPALADAGIVRGITGVYDMTPDARPMLGELPGLPG